jgi:hypothetical protein
VPRVGSGRPRTRPDSVSADKAYSNRRTRRYLGKRKIKACIPEKTDQRKNRLNRGSAGGRAPGFDKERYKARNTVETSKPQCCHIRGSVPSLSSPSLRVSSFPVFMLAA